MSEPTKDDVAAQERERLIGETKEALRAFDLQREKMLLRAREGSWGDPYEEAMLRGNSDRAVATDQRFPREVFACELEVGSWATFEPIYGPEKVLSISRFVLGEPVDGFAQYGIGVEVLHLQIGGRFITRSAYEPVLEVGEQHG